MDMREGMKDGGELPRDVAERMNKLTDYNSAKTEVTVYGTGNTFGGTAIGSNTHIAKGVRDVRTYTHDLVAKHFGVSLITLGYIDGFTKDLEIGKYELWSDMASELRTEIMDSIRVMAVDLLAINPNSDSLDKGNEAGHDIDTSKSVKEWKYVDIFSKMSFNEIDAIVDTIETITKKFSVGDSRSNVTNQVAGANHKVQPKVTSNFRHLVTDPVFEGVNISIPRKVVEKCLKKVVSPPIVSTSNVVTSTIEKNNDGFQKVGNNNNKKKGQSKSTNGSQLVGPSVKQNLRYEPKAATSEPKKRATNVGNTSKSSSMVKSTGNSFKKGNITTSNLYSALENDEEEDEEHVENVYDESANLFFNSKPDESSTFTVAAG
uniref:Zinc knuckle CX2CX4HX4C n=1 Tax=Tanacetum cinerariifolium TaxID=118510 RepID=A0A699H456_TANCI|nr:zinc knuckle CX2CX4HX4C [Tanacetum cinerariifolium]